MTSLAGGPGGFRGREEGDRDRPERRNRDEEFASSRADEVNDWGSTRQFQPSDGPRGGGERRGGFGGDRPPGAADNVDDWGSTRKFEPTAGDRDRPGGFRDGPPRRAGFDPSRADEGDQWGKAFVPSDPLAARGGSRSFGFADRPAPTAAATPADEEDRWARKGPPPADPTPASSGPTQRPRLNLQPRTKPVETSAEGAADGQANSQKSSNPFGAARPREEVLKEKGIDVTKEDLSPKEIREVVVR